MTAPDSASRPPSIAGVGASSVRLPPGAWPSLPDFLDARFPDVGRAVWLARLADGKLSDAETGTLAPDAAYVAGRLVRYYRELPPETPIPFAATILHRDEHLLVADKPHFLPTLPSGRFVQETLLTRLKRVTALDDLVPLHRLDRGTAGPLLFSINPATRGVYSALFAGRQIVKTYEALAPTRDDLAFPMVRRSRVVAGSPFFRQQEVEGEPNAETRIELIETRRPGATAAFLDACSAGRSWPDALRLATGWDAHGLEHALQDEVRSRFPDDPLTAASTSPL